eukprot:c34319_g1_i1 orf=207-929(+)
MALRRGLLRLASISAPTLSSRAVYLAPRSITSQVRDFSAGQPPKATEIPVRIPVKVHGVAGKYAASLYVVAVQAKALEPIYEELNEILKAAEKSSTFGEYLRDLSVPNKERVKAVRTLFEELGFSEISINFLSLLAENGRLHGFQEIMKCLSELVMAYKKQVKATVTTVVELKPKEMDDLKKSLKRFVEPDHTILLDQKIDRRIMGGLVVDIGEKHIDLSIATKLKNMERVLREPLPDLL